MFTHWALKLCGTTLGMLAFFIGYFWLLRHPQFPVTVMPRTDGEQWIGFRPEFLPAYLSLWIYVSLAPALLIERRLLWAYGAGALVLSLIGLGIFFFWPTAVPRADVDWSQHPAFAFLQSVDASGNACPSLHVAFAVFCACWINRTFREIKIAKAFPVLNGLWCVGIIYSTIAIRQHVAVDVFAGAVLGAMVAFLNLRWLPCGNASNPKNH